MIRINLIGERVKEAYFAKLYQPLWERTKTDEFARYFYAECQWNLFECLLYEISKGRAKDSDALSHIHWRGMFQDRTVRRRYHKMIRDKNARRQRHTVCYSCGAPLLMRRQRGTYVPTSAKNQRLCGPCLEECKPIDNGTVGKPVVRIGTRSLKALTQKLVKNRPRPNVRNFDCSTGVGYRLVKSV
jgi:hypothetical protein